MKLSNVTVWYSS